MNDHLFPYLIGVLMGFFLGLGVCFYTSVQPLQQEAIKRGYASFTITNSTHQSTSEFTWK